jgi:hypothetical protein
MPRCVACIVVPISLHLFGRFSSLSLQVQKRTACSHRLRGNSILSRVWNQVFQKSGSKKGTEDDEGASCCSICYSGSLCLVHRVRQCELWDCTSVLQTKESGGRIQEATRKREGNRRERITIGKINLSTSFAHFIWVWFDSLSLVR